MDRTIFYKILDIDGPEEFKYYDNLSALLEEDEYIEEELITDLIRAVDKETLAELTDTYFEEFLKSIPDDESDLYITVESVSRIISGMISNSMDDNDCSILGAELVNFRKWYVQDMLVYNRINGSECSVRDARYDITAAGLLGEKYDYDFSKSCDYYSEGYEYKLGSIEIKENEID